MCFYCYECNFLWKKEYVFIKNETELNYNRLILGIII
ncbi:MAG: hypothetical protein JWR38_944 [Mucilaginibacter sp.]|nr:hypothetical protein [Mucilaginibacter sp.]